MVMFVGRDRELKKLETLYEQREFQFVIFYGRRRVGKTTLMNEFLKDKKSVYYMDVEGTKSENLAASYPAISSMIQSHIDHCWKESCLFFILCGSSMSFMEEQVLGYKSPLYGRRTAQFKIHPFTYFEAKEMLSSYTNEEQAVLYGVTGGIPEFDEPSNLLKQELRDPATYHSIISAIAGGASRLNEIATKTGLETSGCSSQLSSLIKLEIVQKETPITENSGGKKTLYQLNDTMFLFWYRFVRPNLSSIMRGTGEMVYERMVKSHISDFMGPIFEEICHQYLFLPQVYASIPFPIGNLGRWWGNNPRKKCQEEIDLMSVYDNHAFFGECKWKNSLVGTDVIHTLQERGTLFPYTEKVFYIFSKSGFTQEAIEYANKTRDIKLITFAEMNS